MMAEPAPPLTEAQAPPRFRWYQKLSSVLLIIFCLEIGTFLVFFPWINDVWENSLFASLMREGFWENPYFRGALSGVGVVNLYISLAEIFRLRRHW